MINIKIPITSELMSANLQNNPDKALDTAPPIEQNTVDEYTSKPQSMCVSIFIMFCGIALLTLIIIMAIYVYKKIKASEPVLHNFVTILIAAIASLIPIYMILNSISNIRNNMLYKTIKPHAHYLSKEYIVHTACIAILGIAFIASMILFTIYAFKNSLITKSFEFKNLVYLYLAFWSGIGVLLLIYSAIRIYKINSNRLTANDMQNKARNLAKDVNMQCGLLINYLDHIKK